MQALYFTDIKSGHISHILKEIYIDCAYEAFFAGKSDLVILDCGANVGLVSYYMRDYARHIYAIEPLPAHVECIEHMVKFNGLGDKITVCPYALNDTTGTARFYTQGNTTMCNLQGGDQAIEVNTITISDFLDTYGIDIVDFMKVDIEGGEAALVSSPSFAAVCPRIKCIIGEWHGWARITQAELEARLTSLGYRFEWLPVMGPSIFKAER